MLQFLCLQMCVYGGSVVLQGGVGDRHLVTVPQGVVGDRLPWGRMTGGGVVCWANAAPLTGRCAVGVQAFCSSAVFWGVGG